MPVPLLWHSYNPKDILLVMRANAVLHISEAANELGVTPQHLRVLEWQGRIPPARRDFNGRIYTPFDIALLKGMGVGSRPRKLKQIDEVLEAVR
jgi:DNA-binding transcriptional MerR regulator